MPPVDCDILICDDAGISVLELLAQNLRVSGSNPVVRTAAYTEDESVNNCDSFSSSQGILKSLIRHDRILRVAAAGEEFFPLAGCDFISPEQLLLMAAVKTTDGCNALRVFETDSGTTQDCEDEMIAPLTKLMSAFYLNGAKTKAALAVNVLSASDPLLTCAIDPVNLGTILRKKIPSGNYLILISNL